MNRQRHIAQMMRAAAGPPPDSPFPWVHKWDFTAESGGSIPDLMGGVSLTLSGGYTSSTTGVLPTADDAAAVAPLPSLGIDIGVGNTDTYTLLVAVANTYSIGAGNTYGRYFDGYSSGGQRFYLTDALTTITYQKNNTTSFQAVTVPSVSGKPSAVCTDTDNVARIWVSGGGVVTGPTAAEESLNTDDIIFMNRAAHDRAGDAMFVGAGIISQILTDQEYIDAIAELLAL